MSTESIARLKIHFCVLLWGFTGILGVYITLPALDLVWWRMLLVAFILFLIPQVWRAISKIPPKLIGIYCLIGLFVGLHWYTFYDSIKHSNASIAATCMAFAPLFISLIEPIVLRRGFSYKELILSLLVIPAIILVVGGVSIEMYKGIALGAISAFFVAMFSIMNKKWSSLAPPLAVTAIEMLSGTLLLTLLILLKSDTPTYFILPNQQDFILLIVLSLFCTLLPFALSLVALRQLSAYSVQLIINLEPVYTIILAVILLGEQKDLSIPFYIGVFLLISTVMLHPKIQNFKSKQNFDSA